MNVRSARVAILVASLLLLAHGGSVPSSDSDSLVAAGHVANYPSADVPMALSTSFWQVLALGHR